MSSRTVSKSRRGHLGAGARRVLGVALAAASLGLGACNSDRLLVQDGNNPTPEGISADPLTALQLSADGIVRRARTNLPTWISGTGLLGRESYNYTNNEPRNTTTWLQGPQDPGRGAGGSFWDGYYQTVRLAFDFMASVDANPALSEAQKRAAKGFAQTFSASELTYVILAHGQYGAVVEMRANPKEAVPFVSRDSVYNYISGTLDEAAANLQAGGTSFPFSMVSGFTAYGTPATFFQVNRALAARVNAYRASLRVAGCGADGVVCYQQVLQNLAESFLDEADLSAGPAYPFSAAPGDAANGLSQGSAPFIVAHPSIETDAQQRAGGSPDLRYAEKIFTFSPALGPPGSVAGISTNQDFTLYFDADDPIPLITSEELLLLRSEARWFTGDKDGALADLDFIRTTSGGLPATTLTTASSDASYIAALLYERRYSLLFTGQRWVDVRRFGLLETLPVDVPGVQTLFDDLIIPQTECLQRQNVPPELKAPSCS
jgi:hypothetical protein